ncbi:EamA/RhaT family transporter [Xenorhabdus bovienii]|uniref:EamA/RhaT family transporter n=1 Tax=Xenorhabdus bovienii TaxID=40576 RepID=UPI00237CA449|nr:EamA/RhaT family transporter [Xenorhabdus bovienii]MDE1485751.1 EamA/RhaT family transporter [Xenorhabdus bovienii]MDE1495091.1 EamA/RhaT family transporter [Xenorhabdus bovienii]MDE9473142.1 EamA/RhaT family transporter [Xenorhabdus bovienii]MDE9476556.1 EamA/RhaT family transporter [Xenorhabdus bovienii]MDE9529338.1 EamA/RhaT family transporter [Xenorhabdus bovienii]
MTEQGRYLSGVFFTLLYIFIASTQSVLLNIWLFGVNIFLVVSLSFVVVTVLFSIIGFFRQRKAYAELFSQWRMLIALNIVSMFNWLFYFLAVKYLEPSVAVTLTQGLGPVSMTVYLLLTRQSISFVTRCCHLVIFITAAAMCVYTVMFRDVYTLYSRSEMIMGIVIAIFCSISITATVIISKRFAVSKVPASTLLSLRFPLLIMVCLGILLLQDNVVINGKIIYLILLIALVGVSASIYFLQKGIEFATPLAVSTVLALSPLVVFVIQLFNAHTPFSLMLCMMIITIVTVSVVSIIYDARQIGRK